MFCSKCGKEISDQDKFCSYCGALVTTNEAPTESVQKKKSGFKLVYLLIPMMLIIIAQLVVVVVLLQNSPANSNVSDKKGQNTASKKGAESDESSEGLFFADAVEKCSSCEAAITSLIEMQEHIGSFGYNETEVKKCSEQKYQDMHHDCKADIINVVDYPYTYRCAYGYYTGQWQGAGPVGQGSFIGTEPISDRYVSYTGEWKYGLPEGTGKLEISPFMGGWNQFYSGEMKAGMKNGTGVLYEEANLKQTGSDWLKRYRLYEETTFEDDVMTQVTYAEEYSMETNEVVRYFEMIGNEESGWVDIVSTWEAGELSPDERAIVEKAVFVGVAVFVYAEVKDYQNNIAKFEQEREIANQRMMEELEQYQENQKLEAQKRLEEQAARDKKWGENQWGLYLEYKDNPDVPAYQIKNYYYNGYSYRY